MRKSLQDLLFGLFFLIEAPLSCIICAIPNIRSSIASANVASLICSYQLVTGSWEVTMVDAFFFFLSSTSSISV